jgi:Ca2+-binding RTX toxin-like protein
MRKRSKVLAFAIAVTALVSALSATSASARPFFGTGGNDVINGTDRHDYIAGRAGNDTLNGLARWDVLRGGTGDDTINAGRGRDFVFGGLGSDTVNGEAGRDRIHVRDGEADTVDCGDGFDRVWADQSDVVANNCEIVRRHAVRAHRGVFLGTPGDDLINGTERHDYIEGRAGNDTLNGFGAWDVIRAGDGNDTVNAGPGRDFVFGNFGDDLLNGDDGPDLIAAGRGVDTVNGGEGNDRLWALARADVTGTAAGQPNEPADTVNGGPGNDRIHVRDGEADNVDCGEGFDFVLADDKDLVASNCEVLKRQAPRPHDPTEDEDEGS